MGNEHRQDAAENDVLMCAAAFTALNTPDLAAGRPGSLEAFMLRISEEQLAWRNRP